MKSKFIRLNKTVFKRNFPLQCNIPKIKIKNSTTVQHPGIKLGKNKMAAEGMFL
jgi:hypothetical protein